MKQIGEMGIDTELAHSFNIGLDESCLSDLKSIQKKLLGEFREERNYDSSPHLSILTKFLAEEDTTLLINALKKEFENDAVWKTDFSGFSLSSKGDYIFLDLSRKSIKKIMSLHDRALKATKGIGYLGRNKSASSEFIYNPHISIIKISRENKDNALSMVKSMDFLSKVVAISRYEITRQRNKESGYIDFPVIKKLFLSSDRV